VSGGSWSYLYSVYGFVLTVPDYTPNIGAAWYFFSEMFSHFTVLFLSVYQVRSVEFLLSFYCLLHEKVVIHAAGVP
jgi:phosphatidylinositol glycan class U